MEKKVKCEQCGYEIVVTSYRRFIKCHCCNNKIRFQGFDYDEIDLTSSKYANVEYVSDCPACRGKNMMLGPEGKMWLCADCGYKILDRDMQDGVFWICDECDAFLNIQPGFTDKNNEWICVDCGHKNSITGNDIF